LFGRKKVFATGLIGFGLASILCAIAPNNTFLIVVRAVQGIAGALLVPSSLALISTYIRGESFSRAIGLWTAWTGAAFVVGPLVGGFLTDTFSWRLIFALNILPIALTLFLMTRMDKEETRHSTTKVDIWGGVLCALGLAGIVYGLTEQPEKTWTNPLVWGAIVAGTILLILFFWREKRTKEPMLPLELFRKQNFAVGNVATLLVYAGLSAMTLLLVLYLQQVAGFSALYGGLSLLPVTLIMFFLSPRFGEYSKKYGPRWFMALGPIIAAAGLLYIGLIVKTETNYWTQVLPGIIIFGLGLATTVAPLTAAILGDVDSSRSGIASAVNNAVSRIAGLLAIAAIGTVLAWQFSASIEQNISQENLEQPIANFLQEAKNKTLVVEVPKGLNIEQDRAESILKNASLNSFRAGMVAIAVSIFLGGLVSALGIRNKP
jgi:EmrB/QacA subfamily drug resistance transporter